MNFKDYIRPGIGAADITPLLADKNAFHNLIEKLSKLFSDIEVDKIACIEARGFILGSALAFKMNVGIIPLRKEGALKNETHKAIYTDYTGKEKILEIHIDAIKPDEKVLIIDDWVETGGAINAAIELIENASGSIVGIGVLMDDSNDKLKKSLEKYNYKFIEIVLPSDKF